MKRIVAGSIAAGLMLGLSGAAQAANKNASFTVQATVAKACAINAGTLDMGEWVGSGDLTGSSVIGVKCSSGTAFTVDLNAGASSPSLSDRKLVNGTDLLSYNLYRNAALTEIWGDGANSTFTVSGTGTGMANANQQPLTVHAKILEADLLAAKPGTYSNLITATVTY
jgi:spore coat protein U-like protein